MQAKTPGTRNSSPSGFQELPITVGSGNCEDLEQVWFMGFVMMQSHSRERVGVMVLPNGEGEGCSPRMRWRTGEATLLRASRNPRTRTHTNPLTPSPSPPRPSNPRAFTPNPRCSHTRVQSTAPPPARRPPHATCSYSVHRMPCPFHDPEFSRPTYGPSFLPTPPHGGVVWFTGGPFRPSRWGGQKLRRFSAVWRFGPRAAALSVRGRFRRSKSGHHTSRDRCVQNLSNSRSLGLTGGGSAGALRAGHARSRASQGKGISARSSPPARNR